LADIVVFTWQNMGVETTLSILQIDGVVDISCGILVTSKQRDSRSLNRTSDDGTNWQRRTDPDTSIPSSWRLANSDFSWLWAYSMYP